MSAQSEQRATPRHPCRNHQQAHRRHRGRSWPAVHALAPIVRPAVHAGQCPDRERLQRHQHRQPVGVGRGAAATAPDLGDLSPVGRARSPGPQGREVVARRSSTRSTTPTRIPMLPMTTASAAWPVRPTSSTQARSTASPCRRAGAAWSGRAHRAADRFVGATGVRVEHGGERAYYRPSTDHIQMPDEGLFCGTDTMTRSEGYFAVLLHETIHASGAKHRLDRDMGKRFGDARLCRRGARRRDRLGLPVQRAWHHAGCARRPCAVPRTAGSSC